MQGILKIVGNSVEIRFLANLILESLSVTTATNFLIPMLWRTFKISLANFSPVWCSSVKSWRQKRYSWRKGIKITKFQRDRPVGEVQPSKANVKLFVLSKIFKILILTRASSCSTSSCESRFLQGGL